MGAGWGGDASQEEAETRGGGEGIFVHQVLRRRTNLHLQLPRLGGPTRVTALEQASYGWSPPNPPNSFMVGLKIPTITYKGRVHQRLAVESQVGVKKNFDFSIATQKHTALTETLHGSWWLIKYSLTIWMSMYGIALKAQTPAAIAE